MYSTTLYVNVHYTEMTVTEITITALCLGEKNKESLF